MCCVSRRCDGVAVRWFDHSPRITVAWCKRVECPIERVFARTLRDKFPWAMSVPETWRFTPEEGTLAELADDENGDDDGAANGGAGGDEDGDGDEDEDVKPQKKRAKPSTPAAKPAKVKSEDKPKKAKKEKKEKKDKKEKKEKKDKKEKKRALEDDFDEEDD